MRVLDLFSGIGGFSLGLERAGMETVAFCEIDPFCRKVLAKHWPNIPIHEDITKLDGKQYRGAVELVCGGAPCQPFSTAGKRAGKEDDRDLWPEMFRVIREIQPTWVFFENVAGFVSMELDRTLSDLESEGYACQTFDIPACGVDAPHIRHRVWVVGYSSSARGRSGSARDNGLHLGGNLLAPHSRREEEANAAYRSGENVADSASERRGETGSNIKRPEERLTGTGIPWCEWPVEPGVGRVVTGVPGRLDRLRGLGNAVVPQIPEILGRAILDCA